MSQCNDCLGSVQLQQGPVGPTGTAGTAGADSTVAGPQGIQGIQGIQGLGGDDGSILLYTLEGSTEITASSYTKTFAAAWTVNAGTLDSDGDTLRLEALTLPTISDSSLTGMKAQVGGQDVQIGLASGIYDYPNIELRGSWSFKLKLDIVRTSDTTLRMESYLESLLNTGFPNYASEVITSDSSNSSILGNILRTSQVLTVASLTSNDFDVDVLLRTDSASRPIKLLTAKLQFLRKV